MLNSFERARWHIVRRQFFNAERMIGARTIWPRASWHEFGHHRQVSGDRLLDPAFIKRRAKVDIPAEVLKLPLPVFIDEVYEVLSLLPHCNQLWVRSYLLVMPHKVRLRVASERM